MTDLLSFRLQSLEEDRKVAVSALRFYLRMLRPDLEDDGVIEIQGIVDSIFRHLATLYVQVDTCRDADQLLMAHVDGLNEQLGNYDRGVSLELPSHPDD